jgi:hypothetical protein
MNDLTKQFFVKLYLENATSEDYIAWAAYCLEDDFDSKNLRMLAAMEKSSYSYEVEEKFHRVLIELNWKYPNKKETLENYVKDLAKAIVNRELNPADGCHKIYNVIDFLDYPKELSSWSNLDRGLEPKTYETLCDLFEHTSSQNTDKWFKAIIEEAKKLAETNFS